MLTKAGLKLALFYSALFFGFFWIFSLGLYVWMDKSIGDGLIVQQVQQQEQQGSFEGVFDEKSVTIAGNIALDQLKMILLVLNGGLLVVIPLTAWFLMRRTLGPVQAIHEQQRQFASDVSHELRTPLSIISGEIEIALKKDRTRDDYQQTLKSTKEETDRLIQLVEHLLLLTRMEQSKQAREMEAVDVTDLINQMIGVVQQKSKEKQIEILVTFAEESVIVVGQEALLKQLFLNILDNAIKYTPKSGKITIGLSQDKSHGIVTIKDTGVGIAPDQQAKIFDRFYRIEAARSETKGYGLGLAIARAIVALHHGEIHIHSALGKGTTFFLSLPLA
ncbi:sensor histidine kinase [Ktedonobacter racemifer]|uniref:histidine kinase n=1 Tax=Ktedonobacter racemifer DSM 44963 TaxID=485913 RepID=D6TIA1_KTERA|nr:ATP-binding protein [Ktedonobacter racemifer]EFH89158.1 integral membrane sensor signal transduction histidine kinase [Ktedonobacter racemifer DSM 44963]